MALCYVSTANRRIMTRLYRNKFNHVPFCPTEESFKPWGAPLSQNPSLSYQTACVPRPDVMLGPPPRNQCARTCSCGRAPLRSGCRLAAEEPPDPDR